MILLYQANFREGVKLWEEFHDDFEDWDQDSFRRLDRKAAKALREHLVIRGAWVEKAKSGNGGRSWAQCLMACLNETQPAEWTQERLEERAELLADQKRITQLSGKQATNATPHTTQTQQVHPLLQPQITPKAIPSSQALHAPQTP